jgi:hypothetical protein
MVPPKKDKMYKFHVLKSFLRVSGSGSVAKFLVPDWGGYSRLWHRAVVPVPPSADPLPPFLYVQRRKVETI